MIYTLTFNPALDYVVHLNSLELGETNRSGGEELYFGGKGVNVSVILRELEIENTALGFIAGFTGEALEKSLRRQGVHTEFIRLEEGLTRINVKLKAGVETEINAQGPAIGAGALKALFEKLGALEKGDTLVLAGSVPSSLPADIYEQILERLKDRGVRFVVDATGRLLLNVLKYHPFLIKPNHRELEELVERPLGTEDEIIAAAGELQQKGARNVLISRGKNGALLLDEEGRVHAMGAVGGKPVNTVGAGDSMVAGFLAGAERGYDFALRLGSAAGGATACRPGLAKRADILTLLETTENLLL